MKLDTNELSEFYIRRCKRIDWNFKLNYYEKIRNNICYQNRELLTGVHKCIKWSNAMNLTNATDLTNEFICETSVL